MKDNKACDGKLGVLESEKEVAENSEIDCVESRKLQNFLTRSALDH